MTKSSRRPQLARQPPQPLISDRVFDARVSGTRTAVITASVSANGGLQLCIPPRGQNVFVDTDSRVITIKILELPILSKFCTLTFDKRLLFGHEGGRNRHSGTGVWQSAHKNWRLSVSVVRLDG